MNISKAKQYEQAFVTHVDETTNPRCLLQMKVGVERAGLSKTSRAMHIVDFIHEKVYNKM